MTQAPISTDLLPPLLQDFVRLVGLQATMALVGAVGGLRVYIPTPERATPEHPFAVLIGFDSLLKLAAEYGGQPHFQLPKADRALKAVRNAQIAKAYAKDRSARQLAEEFRLTESQVVRIVAAAGVTAPVDRKQQPLF